ncbi:MAG: hypothetical protein R3C11_21410 [Planctomycetaceae bacterium]
MLQQSLHRRNFMKSSLLGAGALLLPTSMGNGAERPDVVNPRATSGDDKYAPDWEQKLTLTVGQTEGDLTGKTDKAIQAAVDYVARLGGGTVKVLPGEYIFDNGIQLPSGVRIAGSGSETIFKKNAIKQTTLAQDSDWFDQEVTFQKGHGFKVGDGVCLVTTNPHNGSQTVLTRTLVCAALEIDSNSIVLYAVITGKWENRKHSVCSR